jgi:hypothetical protein
MKTSTQGFLGGVVGFLMALVAIFIGNFFARLAH